VAAKTEDTAAHSLEEALVLETSSNRRLRQRPELLLDRLPDLPD